MSDDGADVLEILLHETRHAHEYRLTRINGTLRSSYETQLKSQAVDRYQYEFDHYISSDEHYQAYYNQMVEADARRFAAWLTPILAERAGKK